MADTPHSPLDHTVATRNDCINYIYHHFLYTRANVLQLSGRLSAWLCMAVCLHPMYVDVCICDRLCEQCVHACIRVCACHPVLLVFVLTWRAAGRGGGWMGDINPNQARQASETCVMRNFHPSGAL